MHDFDDYEPVGYRGIKVLDVNVADIVRDVYDRTARADQTVDKNEEEEDGCVNGSFWLSAR